MRKSFLLKWAFEDTYKKYSHDKPNDTGANVRKHINEFVCIFKYFSQKRFNINHMNLNTV